MTGIVWQFKLCMHTISFLDMKNMPIAYTHEVRSDVCNHHSKKGAEADVIMTLCSIA